MGRRLAVGVDAGTESTRALVVDVENGAVVASASAPYSTTFPQPAWRAPRAALPPSSAPAASRDARGRALPARAPSRAEQEPRDWLAALASAVSRAVAEASLRDDDELLAIAVDTTCCSVVALDAAGAALRPCLLWMDVRAADEAARVAACGDDPALLVNGGGAGPVSAEWMIPKALWLKTHEPATWAAAATVCEFQDFLNLYLTGRLVASRNNAAVRWHWRAGVEPPASLLARLDLSDLLDKWPREAIAPGDAVGRLTPAAAAALGLPPGLLVAQGGADAFIGMVGLGVIEPGHMALLTGSSHLHLGVAAAPLHGAGVTYADAVLGGQFVVEGGQTSTGSVLAWFRRTFAPGVAYAALDEEAAAVPIGCEGLVAQEHFQGNRTPHTDPGSRGVLAGLSLHHGRGHVFRALMEGVALGTRLIVETMRARGYAPRSITVAGGALNSPLWLRIHADAVGLPLTVTRCADAPALGCAVLAAVAAGAHADVRAACAAMVHVERVVEPDAAAHEQYGRVAAAYNATYPAIRPVLRLAAAAGGAPGAA